MKIEAFEGPLDLLLHLINRLEIDIYDIPVAEVTDQYLMYVHTMKELELDVASEYLVMAATLLAIKSKMLLPRADEPLEEEFEYEIDEDPREELVERLLEYRKYKEAASRLKEMESERGLVFTKPPSDLSEYANDIEEPKELNVTVYDMLAAFQKLLRRKKLESPLSAKISRQEISIEERMADILEELKKSGKRKSFFSLFPSNDKGEIVITFLSVLELMKRGKIIVEQEKNFADIFIVGKEDTIDWTS